MKISQAVIVALLAVAAVQFVYYYPLLPTTIASHFAASGAPDSWQPKSVFFALFAFVYLLFAGIYYWLPHLILTLPTAFINLPNKAYWLAPRRRAATADWVADNLSWLGVGMLALIIATGQLAINANLPGATHTLSPVIWMLLAGYLVVGGWWVLRWYRKFRRV